MAKFWTDFGDEPLGVHLPDGFSLRFGDIGVDADIEVIDETKETELDGELTNNRAVMFTQHTGRNFLSWDTVGEPSTVDIVARVADRALSNVRIGPGFRVSTGPRDYYAATLQALEIRTRIDSINHDENFPDGQIEERQFLYIRVWVDNGSIKSAAGYNLEDVTGENPTNLLVDETDPDPTASGWAGIFLDQSSSHDAYIDWIGVGTDGDVAPTSSLGEEHDPEDLTVTVDGTTASLSWPAPDMTGATDTDVFRRGPYATEGEVDDSPFDPEVDSRITRVPVATLTYDDEDLDEGFYAWQVFPVEVP